MDLRMKNFNILGGLQKNLILRAGVHKKKQFLGGGGSPKERDLDNLQI